MTPSAFGTIILNTIRDEIAAHFGERVGFIWGGDVTIPAYAWWK